MLIARLTSKRRATRSALRRGEISGKERRARVRAVAVAAVDAVQAGAVAVVGAVGAVVGADRLALGRPRDGVLGYPLCPIIKRGTLRTPVKYVVKYV